LTTSQIHDIRSSELGEETLWSDLYYHFLDRIALSTLTVEAPCKAS
jgi:hypothetical protein